MKRRLIALVGVLVLTLGMGITATAAESPKADTVIAATTSGQNLTSEDVKQLAAKTTLETTVTGATITAVDDAAAARLVGEANAQVGKNVSVVTMVDINVPAGTGAAEFTLKVSGVAAGQKVQALHLKADGTVEKLTVVKVAKDSVTIKMTSYSPVAIVTNATAPKTSQANVMMLIILAVGGVAGALVCGKRLFK